jgi:hypothetical protein
MIEFFGRNGYTRAASFKLLQVQDVTVAAATAEDSPE